MCTLHAATLINTRIRFDPTSVRIGLPAEGKPITVEGQRGGDMYIVMKGQVQVVQEHKKLGVLEQHNFCESKRASSNYLYDLILKRAFTCCSW